jgi:hypothetical protein
VTSRQSVALVLGLVAIFAVALAAGVGSEEAPTGARAGVGGYSSEVQTAAITVVLGFVVFVLGQIAQRFFIEPVQEQRRIIGRIAYVVLYYANVMALAPKQRQDQASEELRKLAGELRSTLWTVPWYRLFQGVGLVVKREDIISASAGLVGWSNSVHMRDGTHAAQHMATVARALDLPRE